MRLRDARRAVRTNAAAAVTARRALRRLPCRWRAAAECARSTTGVDADLVLAVMAVEHGERGRLARGVEYAYALGLCALRRQADAEWVSVGPAQVQLRHAGAATPLVPRLVHLATVDGAAGTCAAFIARECSGMAFDPASPGQWTHADWEAFGCTYAGPLATGYGEAVRIVWSRLRLHPDANALGAEPALA